MKAVVILLLVLGCTLGGVHAQVVEQEVIWYWGIDAEAATLVAYNVQGEFNTLDVPLDPLNPQAIIWRVDVETAFALVEIDHQYILYQLTPDSAERLFVK